MVVSDVQFFSRETIGQLLRLRNPMPQRSSGLGKRKAQRHPFPAAMEMWVPFEDGSERHVRGRCADLTESGVGVQCDEPFEVGATMPIAALQRPTSILYGRGTVRHCSKRGDGYLVGFEFEL